MRHHFTLTTMAIINKTIANVCEDVEKWEHSYIANGNIKCYSHIQKQFEKNF